MRALIRQYCALSGNATDCGIGGFIGLQGKKIVKITQIAAEVSFNDYR
jgi:hypothetical protein